MSDKSGHTHYEVTAEQHDAYAQKYGMEIKLNNIILNFELIHGDIT